MISGKNIHKKYGAVEVLKGVDMEIARKEIVSIVGPSGSGKSTLLHILGTLDKADTGVVKMNNVEVNKLNGNRLAEFRNRHIGFVFQFHHLLPEFSALENVCIPGWLAGRKKNEVTNEARRILEMLGLGQRLDNKPNQLSGGEQQRVAVARSLINKPEIVFADDIWYFTIPFLATVFYLAHPLHVEVVANIKGRDEIFALLGELACIYFSIKYLAGNKNRYLLFSFLSILLAMLSKEGAITFLAVIPLTAHFFTNAGSWKKFIVTLPVLAAFLFYLLMRMNAIGYLLDDKEVTDLMNNPFYGLAYGEKTATIFYTLLLYLKLHLFPVPLTHDYYPYQVPVMSWGNWQPILSLILHLGLVAVIIKGWKKKSPWAWCAAFYIITMSIVSNLVVSVGTFMNDRFAYHASLAFCVALAYLLSGKSNFKIRPAVSMVIAAIFIAFFSFITLKRLPDWKSEKMLDASAIKHSPNSARSNCFYGISIWQNVYLSIPPENIQRRLAVLDSMHPYFEKSVQILPAYSAAHTMRAGVAAEYHKINQNYDSLIRVFESINRSGVNEPFVVNYLNYLNTTVSNRADAEKLALFYSRMINFYPAGHSLHNQYRSFEAVITERLRSLPG